MNGKSIGKKSLYLALPKQLSRTGANPISGKNFKMSNTAAILKDSGEKQLYVATVNVA